MSDNGDRTLGGGIITSDLKEGSPKIVKSELLKVLDHKQKELNLTNFFTLKNKDNHPSKYKYNSLYTKLKKISKNVVQKNNSLKNDDLYLNTHVNIVNNINKIHQENQNLMKVRKLKRHNSSTPLQDSKSPIVFRSRETSAGFSEKPKTNSKNGTQENNGYGLNSFIISSSLANSAKGLVPPKEKINWVKSFIVDLKTGVLFKDYNKRNMEDLSSSRDDPLS